MEQILVQGLQVFGYHGVYEQEKEEGQMIWILTSKKELLSLSKCSEIVKALLKMPNKTKKRIYFAKENRR